MAAATGVWLSNSASNRPTKWAIDLYRQGRPKWLSRLEEDRISLRLSVISIDPVMLVEIVADRFAGRSATIDGAIGDYQVSPGNRPLA